MKLTINYKKHHSSNPLQRLLIRNFYKQLMGLVRDLKVSSVLDVGCAEGFALEELRKHRLANTFEGIDLSRESVKLGQKLHPKINLSLGNVYKTKYRPAQFDLVMCTEVLEHLDKPKMAVKEISRISNKYCLLSVPNEPWFRLANFFRGKNLKRWGNDIEHIQHWTRNQFVRMVAEMHLKPKLVRIPFPWTMVLAEK